MNPREYHADEPIPGARRKHKHSTADQKPTIKWKKICKILLYVLLMVAVMIALSLLMNHLFNPDEEDGFNNSTTASGEPIEGGLIEVENLSPFTKNLEFFEAICTAERLGSSEREYCENACTPSDDCCNPFEAGNSTCFIDFTAGCFTYAKCHALTGYVDPAHKDLDRVCDTSAVEINREECENECAAVRCCYTDEDSCIFTNFLACMDYAPCQNLRQEDGILLVAPTDLDERCDKETPTCRKDCRDAECCFSDSDTDSCLQDNFISCLSYSTCVENNIYDSMEIAPIYSKVDPAPLDISTVCSFSHTNETGPELCQAACKDWRCCVLEDDDSCFMDDPLGCIEYLHCSILNSPMYSSLTYSPTNSLTGSPSESPTASPVVATPVPTISPTAGMITAATTAPTAGMITAAPTASIAEEDTTDIAGSLNIGSPNFGSSTTTGSDTSSTTTEADEAATTEEDDSSSESSFNPGDTSFAGGGFGT